MTSETTDANLGLDEAGRGMATEVANLIERSFCDRLGQLRRPVLLLTIICVDLAIVALTGVAAYVLTAPSGFSGLISMSAVLTMPCTIVGVLQEK